MYALLGNPPRVLQRAILRTVVTLKDTKAIPAVKSYASHVKLDLRPRDPAVAEAENALADLEAIALLSRDSETLLRPAGPGEGLLLRPSVGTTAADPAILLQASSKDSSRSCQQ